MTPWRLCDFATGPPTAACAKPAFCSKALHSGLLADQTAFGWACRRPRRPPDGLLRMFRRLEHIIREGFCFQGLSKSTNCQPKIVNYRVRARNIIPGEPWRPLTHSWPSRGPPGAWGLLGLCWARFASLLAHVASLLARCCLALCVLVVVVLPLLLPLPHARFWFALPRCWLALPCCWLALTRFWLALPRFWLAVGSLASVLARF